MPWEERHKVGVSKDYNNKRETRRAAYEVFESFMFDRIQKNRGDAAAILVICGSYHMERLAKLFLKAGDEVQSDDTYERPGTLAGLRRLGMNWLIKERPAV